MNKPFSLLFTTLVSLSITAYASPASHIVVAPNCLLQKINHPYHTLSTKNKLALIEIDEAGINQLIAAKHPQKTVCGGFMDVTEAWHQQPQHQADSFLYHYTNTPKTSVKTTYEIKYPAQVNQLLSQMNTERLWNNLKTLTYFHDRYSDSDDGVLAATWIKYKVESIANGRPDISVYLVPTKNYKQPSVVAKIGTGTGPGIVIGGHLDTTSGVKPGADDDGTGTATVLETAETLINSGMHFKKPIYFIWYAAEEVGLVGSQSVVKDFKKKNIPVSEVMQLDMTGYPDPMEPYTMWLMNDYVSPPLTAYLETLINTYVQRPVKHDECGYACSDHATWTQNGYTAAIPFESAMDNYNPYIHTSQDTIEKLSLAHMTDYLKLALAFAVELAEPADAV